MLDKQFVNNLIDYAVTNLQCVAEVEQKENVTRLYYLNHYVCRINNERINVFKDYYDKQRGTWEYERYTYPEQFEDLSFEAVIGTLNHAVSKLAEDIEFEAEHELIKEINNI